MEAAAAYCCDVDDTLVSSDDLSYYLHGQSESSRIIAKIIYKKILLNIIHSTNEELKL